MFCRYLVIASILILSSAVNAAYLDNGSYTTDDVSGLDWLDLSVTGGQIYNNAETLNPGWQYATNAQVEGLFAQAFSGFYPTDSRGLSIGSDGAYANQLTDILAFQSLFGFTDPDDFASYGFYLDEDSILRNMGGYYNGNATAIFGIEFVGDGSAYLSEAHPNVGIYMVRAVPLPATAWLFLSALGGLVIVKRKRS